MASVALNTLGEREASRITDFPSAQRVMTDAIVNGQISLADILGQLRAMADDPILQSHVVTLPEGEKQNLREAIALLGAEQTEHIRYLGAWVVRIYARLEHGRQQAAAAERPEPPARSRSRFCGILWTRRL